MPDRELIEGFDSSKFDLEPYADRIEKPWGHELHFNRPDHPYMCKILHINAGHILSKQYHRGKTETWILISGRAFVHWNDDEGKMVTTALMPQKAYTCYPGQIHRLQGVTDCDIFEASTPEFDDTVRLEDKYGRPEVETAADRALPNRGWVDPNEPTI